MSRELSILPRFNSVPILSLVCLISSACANTTPVMEPSNTDRAKLEATATELRKSAEAGDASAQNRLGLLYDEGVGVPQSSRQAKEWFEKSANQGHVGAQVNLGTLYYQGEGAPQSYQMASVWFEQAAGQGDPLASAKLGWMYERGLGVLQDFVQAHMWYNLAAVGGEPRAAAARDALTKQMTTAQIAEAQRLAREWRPKRK